MSLVLYLPGTVPVSQLSKVVPALWTGSPFTVYVDRHNGSDSNSGRSEADALATLEPAIAMLNQSVHGGRVLIVGPDAGAYTVSAGQHFVRGIRVESISPNGVEIDRNFNTTASRSFYDAVTTAAGSSCTSATASFVSGDVNKIISVYGAGTGGGTFYDFISAVPNGTTATLTGTTPIARSSSTDANGVKGQVLGDWNRVVTDAVTTASSHTLTSATGAFTSSDVGRVVVVAGAGQGNQALCSAIQSINSSTSVELVGKATNTTSGKRCAIGVETGELFTFHVPRCGLKNLYLLDPTTDHRARIGAAYKMVVDDGYGSSTGEHVIEDVFVTNSDTQSAWEHDIEIDGSWNQNVGGGGVRKVVIRGGTYFGSRRPTETVRINTAVHVFFDGGGFGGASPITGTGADAVQGIAILDPHRTMPAGSMQTSDIHFTGWEGIDADFYSEGQYITFVGGRLGWTGTQPTGRKSITFSTVAADNFINCEMVDTAEDAQVDSGSGNRNRIFTSLTGGVYDYGTQAGGYHVVTTTGREGIRKVTMSSSNVTIDQPTGAVRKGARIGYLIKNSTGANLTPTWSSVFKRNGTITIADTKTQLISFTADDSGSNFVQDNTPFDY